MSSATGQAVITLSTLQHMMRGGEKIACLTCYDATFAEVAEVAGIDVLLVGDSLGMVLQGHDSTLPVSLADMIYHSACVARGSSRCLRIADMPFMSYTTPAQGIGNAARLMGEGGAQMVKLEGGSVNRDVVRYLVQRGIPVCAHLGLLPQSVHGLGGYRVQGRDPQSAETIFRDARILEEAGASMLVLECVPADLAARITDSVSIPVIGIGAGPGCDGQVLVLHDLLGITVGRRPKFTQDFLSGKGDIRAAIVAYQQAVKSETFPGPEHSF
jgi:3-methyl-2-oxobutanoate hydroxymethyltransferase